MRSALAAAAHKRAGRSRNNSISSVPPAAHSGDFDPELAAIAASILYRSPLPSPAGRRVYILNAAAFPDAAEVDYDSLLSYVLARLPGEDELLSGTEYEIVFFAGGPADGATAEKRQGPGMGWHLQAYHVLSRAMRKKLQRLYIVHPRTWVRVLVGVFATVVSPKSRRKIVHENTLTALAEQMPIHTLLIPPAVYLHDRKLQPDICVPEGASRRAFGARHALPRSVETGDTRLPRVLRETTSFILMPVNVRTEGLFRISPHATQQHVLREAYDRGQQFIVWKERGATFTQPGMDVSLVREIRIEDAYGVHLAASLIKQWYRDLRDPIFPNSTYDYLRSVDRSTHADVRPEMLIELLDPRSPTSALTVDARHILIRHLLPLLSKVAVYAADNKMGPDNLAICFSMCLICGPDQLEDAKMSSILKRILSAAVSLWPQLRDGMEVPETAFEIDLQPPADPRDYEDTLVMEQYRQSSSHSDDGHGEHRIQLQDTENSPPATLYTAVPMPFSGPIVRKQPPAVPPPRRSSNRTSPIEPTEPSPAVPPRKPAPQAAEPPPRYSTVVNGNEIDYGVSASPIEVAPIDGYWPPRKSSVSSLSPLPAYPDPAVNNASMNMPKRKALSRDVVSYEGTDAKHDERSSLRAASDGDDRARLAAQQGAVNLAQQAAALARANGSAAESAPLPVPASSANDDHVFRKPSWPASAARQGSSSRSNSQAPPLVRQPSNGTGRPRTPNPIPRPRAPSPALLKRMSSMELGGGGDAAQLELTRPLSREPPREPRRLDLQRSSVDDLRRLYEERASTVQSLARAGLVRKHTA